MEGDVRPMIRVLAFHHDERDRDDVFLSKAGDQVALRVPGGQAILHLSGGTTASGTIHCHLRFYSDATLDLSRRRRVAERIEERLDSLRVDDGVPDDVLQPIRDYLAALVPEGRGE